MNPPAGHNFVDVFCEVVIKAVVVAPLVCTVLDRLLNHDASVVDYTLLGTQHTIHFSHLLYIAFNHILSIYFDPPNMENRTCPCAYK